MFFLLTALENVLKYFGDMLNAVIKSAVLDLLSEGGNGGSRLKLSHYGTPLLSCPG